MALEEPVFISDQHLRIGTDNFYCDYQWAGNEPVPEGFLGVQKLRAQVERYIALQLRLNPAVVVELGIRRGGGSALLHALFQPSLLIGIELDSQHAADLPGYIDKHNLGQVLKPYYGVDQADRQRLAEIMAAQLQGRPIDLVIDDASHLLQPSRASFECLFPRLREGGLYIIEDWNCDHVVADGIAAVLSDPAHPNYAEVTGAIELRQRDAAPAKDPRLVRLALELVLARASSQDVVREVTVMDNWLLIQRGAAIVDADSFRLASISTDHFANLA